MSLNVFDDDNWLHGIPEASVEPRRLDPAVVASVLAITGETREHALLPDGETTILIHGVPLHGHARGGLVNIHPTPEEFTALQEAEQRDSRPHRRPH